MNASKFLAPLMLAAASVNAFSQSPVTLTVETHQNVAQINPGMYGLMTEEINHSYDGGLYAEMVRNRTLDKSWAGFEYWNLVELGTGRAEMDGSDDGPSKALPKSMKVVITSASAKNEAGIANGGWWGMDVRPSTTYTGSFYAKPEGITEAHVSLISDDTGATLAEAKVPLDGAAWKQYTYSLKTDAKVKAGKANHLIITFAQPGSIQLQLISLFPPTYRNRANGNREDLMKLMAAMSPHFLRLPGGNYLEGDTIKERFNWRETVGPLVDRPTHRSPWNYQSSDGMGLLEMLEWCEDLKIEPLLAVYGGYSLKGELVVGDDLKPFIQEDLDEIEYATGATSTKYGAMRARDGHPAPFHIQYIEIGNEDFFDKKPTYDERFSQIAAAIREKYPNQFKLIATTPVKKGDPDFVDDHFYKTPEEFFAMVHHYDNADRKGPKIFVGEWATRIGDTTPNFAGALGDAAWMTGMERNADLVQLASYAPLLTNVNPDGMQWSPNLIGYDASRSYGSPSYWVQVLFDSHLGDHVVKSAADHEEGLFFWSTTISTAEKTLHVKLVNASDRPQPVSLKIDGVRPGKAKVETLHAASRWATNTIDTPNAIVPTESTLAVSGDSLKLTLPGNTVQVIDVPVQ
ncbi:MAG: alpha-L-arabinofuranosidase C-terminal domain-containing protein [Acidobacteriaceae bacterium]|nr:alpha-L-arabinofuranosidase C-terminal domain-containing protein [Acidobacteriaceae bacterium]